MGIILPLLMSAAGAIFKIITESIGIQKTAEYDRIRLTSMCDIEKFRIMYGGTEPMRNQAEQNLQLLVGSIIMVTITTGLLYMTVVQPTLMISKEVNRSIPWFINMFFPMSSKGTLQVSIMTLWFYYFSFGSMVVTYLFTRIPFTPARGISVKDNADAVAVEPKKE